MYTAGAGPCQAPSAGTRVGALGDRGDPAGARAERGKLRHAVRLGTGQADAGQGLVFVGGGGGYSMSRQV